MYRTFLMAKASEWRKIIEDHFEPLKVQAIVRATEAIASLTLEECLEKFDKGTVEHGEDLGKNFNVDAAFREEIVDSLNYTAYMIHFPAVGEQ